MAGTTLLPCGLGWVPPSALAAQLSSGFQLVTDGGGKTVTGGIEGGKELKGGKNRWEEWNGGDKLNSWEKLKGGEEWKGG